MLELIDKEILKNIELMKSGELSQEEYFVNLYKKSRYPFLYQFIMERTYILADKNNYVIYPRFLIKLDIHSPVKLNGDSVYFGDGDYDDIEIYPGFYFKKGVVYKILDRFKMKKSLIALLSEQILLDSEINLSDVPMSILINPNLKFSDVFVDELREMDLLYKS